MAVAIGSRVGSYEILAAIGTGGIREVSRARHSKLGRDVAIQVRPEAFARDADRMARFPREANVLASFDHPNVAAIHNLAVSGNRPALVMQPEGPSLADRIKAGPMAIDEAPQIAGALEYAHEHGIIQGDLNAANVKVASNVALKNSRF